MDYGIVLGKFLKLRTCRFLLLTIDLPRSTTIILSTDVGPYNQDGKSLSRSNPPGLACRSRTDDSSQDSGDGAPARKAWQHTDLSPHGSSAGYM